jgi:cytochrome P450
MGIHQCIGQHVARLEAEAAITALDRRVARIELTGSPRRHHNNTLRGWGPVRCACTMPDTNRQGE